MKISIPPPHKTPHVNFPKGSIPKLQSWRIPAGSHSKGGAQTGNSINQSLGIFVGVFAFDCSRVISCLWFSATFVCADSYNIYHLSSLHVIFVVISKRMNTISSYSTSLLIAELPSNLCLFEFEVISLCYLTTFACCVFALFVLFAISICIIWATFFSILV